MTDLRIVPATRELAEQVLADLRPEEHAELTASDGPGWREPVLAAMEESRPCLVAFIGGELVAIWGVRPAGRTMTRGRIGTVWMLTTNAVERHRRAFWSACLVHFPALFEGYDTLRNAIDARYEKAVRWARRLGLPLQEAAPFGVAGLPFHRFQVRRDDVCAGRR